MVKIVFRTAVVIVIFWFWYASILVDMFWETTSIRCQPSPIQVICHIANEPYLGGTNLKIPKAQLTGIEYIYRAMEGRRIQWIVLTTIDREGIPLHRSRGGKIISQLVKYKEQIAKFIANPQAQTLNIKTHQRNMPLQVSLITGGIILFGCLYLNKLWKTSKSDKF